MNKNETIIKKVGNTTIIINPPSARTQEEIEQVLKNFNEALYRAWSNIQAAKQNSLSKEATNI